MISTIITHPSLDFSWIDVLAISDDDYEILVEKYGLHPESVKDCMEPFHLPKFEMFDGYIFILTRVYDENSNEESDTVQKITNKMAIFITDKKVITIHRKKESCLSSVISNWQEATLDSERTKSRLVNHILQEMLNGFEKAIRISTEKLDENEQNIFINSKDPKIIRDLYNLKRRASIFKRMISLSKDAIIKYAKLNEESPYFFDLSENASHLYYTVSDLDENVNNTLNLHISLASHRTNEVMGVLTVFSVFFLPLTFIVGLYGMNFKHMPELEFKHGYTFVWAVMIGSAIATYIWFKRKGWI